MRKFAILVLKYAKIRSIGLKLCLNSHGQSQIVLQFTYKSEVITMLYMSKDGQQAKKLSRLYLEKKVRKLYRGIYTDDLTLPLENIVQQNWMQIVSNVVSDGILSYRTAIELKPHPFKEESIVFMTGNYAKTITLPGLVIKVYKGDTHQFLEQILPTLAKSNTPRLLLENLSVVRGIHYQGIKTVGTTGVEKSLTKELQLRGEKQLNQIRDEAKLIASALGYKKEYERLNQIISALLATHPENILSTSYAKAAARQQPYDEKRVKLFEELVTYIKKCTFLQRDYNYQKASFRNLNFYESYFSNYIEGTEFLIDEAEDIVFKGIEVPNRHADSHDVLAHFTISNDYSEMHITPATPEELIHILQTRHAILMKERPEKRPGEFKKTSNKAGNTLFVAPNDVLGTLCQGFEYYKLLNPGMEKALFMHFLISEVHPFDDGNGRLSRIMMNAEFVSNDSFKIIIPTVHRDNYLSGLRLASRDSNFRTYVKIIDQAQAYTATIHWADYGDAREKIETDNAHLTPDEGLAVFNRALRQLKLADIPA